MTKDRRPRRWLIRFDRWVVRRLSNAFRHEAARRTKIDGQEGLDG